MRVFLFRVYVYGRSGNTPVKIKNYSKKTILIKKL